LSTRTFLQQTKFIIKYTAVINSYDKSLTEEASTVWPHMQDGG